MSEEHGHSNEDMSIELQNSQRSASSINSSHQGLTGLKPKALIFESPIKSTPNTKHGPANQSAIRTTSTKDKTSSFIGFGVSSESMIRANKLKKNRGDNCGDNSPPIMRF